MPGAGATPPPRPLHASAQKPPTRLKTWLGPAYDFEGGGELPQEEETTQTSTLSPLHINTSKHVRGNLPPSIKDEFCSTLKMVNTQLNSKVSFDNSVYLNSIFVSCHQTGVQCAKKLNK